MVGRLAAALVLMAAIAPAAAPEEGPLVSALNPNAPAPVGFIAPTLDGDWRFRAAINGWVPNVIGIEVDTALGGGSLDEDLGWLLRHLVYYVPIDLEVRKGSFGVYFHSLFLGISGKTELFGPVQLDWDDNLFLMDIGASYELARWRLWESERSPELTLEPFAEARLIYDPVDVSILGLSTTDDLSSTVPVVGLRMFIDLTKHWNLQLQGDYGGFGIDDNHQTWQAVGLVGYRWKGWSVHWNFQVGYRAMRLFDLRRGGVDTLMDARGADIILGVEF